MSGDRHPLVEALVFGLAGALALILAYHAYARWSAGRAYAPTAPAASDVAAPPPQAGDADTGGGVGFKGGGSVPTVRFSQPKRGKRK